MRQGLEPSTQVEDLIIETQPGLIELPGEGDWEKDEDK